MSEVLKELLYKKLPEIISDNTANVLDTLNYQSDEEADLLSTFLENIFAEIIREYIKQKKIFKNKNLNTQLVEICYQEIVVALSRECSEKIINKFSAEVYNQIRDKIKESVDGGFGLIIIIGAGVSPAPSKIDQLAEQILRKNNKFPDKYEYDFTSRGSEKWIRGWQLLEEHRSEFGKEFTQESIGKPRPSTCQNNIAVLYDKEKIKQLIIFNWDNLIECSLIDKYKKGLTVGEELLIRDQKPNQSPAVQSYVWHPHGYISRPDFGYILPHEEGFISDELLKYCIDNFHGTYVVIGFNDEKHKKFHNLLLKMPNLKREVIRIIRNVKSSGFTMDFDGDDFSKLLVLWIIEDYKKIRSFSVS